MIAVEGRVAPEFSALIAASSHFVIWPSKIFASVSGESFSFTPERLYDTVIGAATVGK